MDTKDENQILTEESADTENTQVPAEEEVNTADTQAISEEDASSADTQDQEEGALSESEKRAKFYEACYRLGEAKTISELLSVERIFEQLEGYQDCDKRLEQCREKRLELEKQKAAKDAENAQRLEKLRDEYTQLRDEAKRCESTMRASEAAKRLTEISEKLLEGYTEIEGAEDYAREFAQKAKALEREDARRRSFEKKSAVVATVLQIAAVVIYVLAFVKSGSGFRPLVPLIICDCILFSSLSIAFLSISNSGSYVGIFGFLGFFVIYLATLVLCIAKKLALGILGYILLIVLPIVIGFNVGVFIGLLWRSLEARVVISEKNKG